MIKYKDLKFDTYYKDDRLEKHYYFIKERVTATYIFFSYWLWNGVWWYYGSTSSTLEEELFATEIYPNYSWFYKYGRCPGDPTESQTQEASVKVENSVKRVIKENKDSKTCQQCSKPTKEVFLLRRSTFYCPDCEP